MTKEEIIELVKENKKAKIDNESLFLALRHCEEKAEEDDDGWAKCASSIKNRIARQNVGFMIHLASKTGSSRYRSDVESDIFLSCARAIEGYNPHKGKWSTYFGSCAMAAYWRSCGHRAKDRLKCVGEGIKYYNEQPEYDEPNEKLDILYLVLEKTPLTERERQVIQYRYLDGGIRPTFREIGEKWGVSAQFIGQIENKALKKLRKMYKYMEGNN